MISNKVNVEKLGVILETEDNERFSKFNAGMVKFGDRVEMLYRWSEVGKNPDGISVDYKQDFLSRAQLSLDGKLVRDFDEVYIGPFNEMTTKGCQDPRIVFFEGAYYIFFVCFDGYSCRVGIAKTSNFDSFDMLGIIPTISWDKDAFIFPERINGKIAYVHRFEPDIQLDYFDTFEDMFDESFWKNYESNVHDSVILKGVYEWENKKIGGSVPPIKTPEGWLFIYHSVADDREPFCYRAGVALLDLENPAKVIARLPYPLIEPTEDYELDGDVKNVVFPQGAYEHDGDLYISYGGADKVVAMAKLNMQELMNELNNHRI